MRWLDGQIPQILEVMPGISHSSRPSQNFSKPRNSFTWNRVSSTVPFLSSWMVIFACPSIRVTGSIVSVRVMVSVSSVAQEDS